MTAKLSRRFAFWLSAEQLLWLMAEAKAEARTLGDVLRRLIDKAREG